MKKSSILMAGLAALTMTAFSSCQEERNPKIDAPTVFVLNTPAMGENTYYLSAASDIELSWSQPNYGAAIVANYEIQIADNAEFENAGWICAPGAETANIYQTCKTTITGQELSLAIMHLYGWEDADSFDASPRKVYLRVFASVPDFAAGDIYSNPIELTVVPYFVVLGADEIYLVGAPNGWDISGDSMPLVETEVGSKIYKGTYDIPADQFTFRFYDKLGDWEHYSIGSQDADEDVTITFTDGKYSGACFYDPDTNAAGKGKWHVDDWQGGVVTMTVDLNKMTVLFESVTDPGQIYLIGAPSGWDINSKAMPLTEEVIGSRIYTATYDIEAGAAFRFYTELGDWENNSIGSQVPDEDITVSLPYSGECVDGKGKWNLTSGGKVHMTVDLNAMTVSFELE